MVICAARLVAGQRSAASQAPSLLPPHPLSFLRRRLVGVSTQSSHCQDSAGSTAPLLVNRSEVLPRTRWRVTRRAHKACSHGALTRCTHNSTPRLRRRGHLLSSPEARALSGQIIAPASGAAAGRALGYRPRLNCEVRGQLLPLDLGPASSSSWTRSVCRPRLASAPPRTQHLNPAHTRAQPTGTARPLLLGRRRALETVDAEVGDAGSTMPSTAPAVAAVVSLATAA